MGAGARPRFNATPLGLFAAVMQTIFSNLMTSMGLNSLQFFTKLFQLVSVVRIDQYQNSKEE